MSGNDDSFASAENLSNENVRCSAPVTVRVPRYFIFIIIQIYFGGKWDQEKKKKVHEITQKDHLAAAGTRVKIANKVNSASLWKIRVLIICYVKETESAWWIQSRQSCSSMEWWNTRTRTLQRDGRRHEPLCFLPISLTFFLKHFARLIQVTGRCRCSASWFNTRQLTSRLSSRQRLRVRRAAPTSVPPTIRKTRITPWKFLQTPVKSKKYNLKQEACFSYIHFQAFCLKSFFFLWINVFQLKGLFALRENARFAPRRSNIRNKMAVATDWPDNYSTLYRYRNPFCSVEEERRLLYTLKIYSL